MASDGSDGYIHLLIIGEMNNYYRADTTQAFLIALSQSLETPVESQNANSRFGESKGLVEVIKGGNLAGTWVHPPRIY